MLQCDQPCSRIPGNENVPTKKISSVTIKAVYCYTKIKNSPVIRYFNLLEYIIGYILLVSSLHNSIVYWSLDNNSRLFCMTLFDMRGSKSEPFNCLHACKKSFELRKDVCFVVYSKLFTTTSISWTED